MLQAFELAAEGACRHLFALVHPPGHHVGRSGPLGGFCFLNNIAVGVAHLLEKYVRILCYLCLLNLSRVGRIRL